MTKQLLATRILVTLYRAASRGRLLTESGLADLMDVQFGAIEGLLLELDQAGFLDRSKLRLTLAGLALAVAASKKSQSRSFSRAA